MSKRQNTLFNRMRSAKERYTKSRNALNGMLLHELHRHGVYTPDQFHEAYVTKREANEFVEKERAKFNQR